MKHANGVAVAALVSLFSTSAFAFEVGDFNGTKFSVGGYIKAEGIFNRPDSGNNSFDSSARQSRINFKAARNVQGHKITGFLEGDFYGGNASGSTYDWRLRHAYIRVDNLTVGQTWNGQFLATAPFDAGMINFFAPGTGTIGGNGAVVRPDTVLHYETHGFRLSLQDPVYSDANLPDMVVSYTHRLSGGSGFNIAVTGREVDTTPSVSSDDQSEFGAALSFASKWMLGPMDSLHLSAYGGKGAGVYAGYGYNGAKGAATSDVNAAGDLVEQKGFAIGYKHKFTDKLTGTLRYGQVNVDETAAGVNDTFRMTDVNLIYSYLPGLDVGIEWRDQNAANHPLRPKGQQIEVMAMYKF